MAEVTLEFIGELMQRMLTELRELRGELRSLEDQVLVQGAILIRLDARQPSTSDTVLTALQSQIQHLSQRLRKLEDAT